MLGRNSSVGVGVGVEQSTYGTTNGSSSASGSTNDRLTVKSLSDFVVDAPNISDYGHLTGALMDDGAVGSSAWAASAVAATGGVGVGGMSSDHPGSSGSSGSSGVIGHSHGHPTAAMIMVPGWQQQQQQQQQPGNSQGPYSYGLMNMPQQPAQVCMLCSHVCLLSSCRVVILVVLHIYIC